MDVYDAATAVQGWAMEVGSIYRPPSPELLQYILRDAIQRELDECHSTAELADFLATVQNARRWLEKES